MPKLFDLCFDMLLSCANCEFYVRQDEAFCPNCGLVSPERPLETRSENYSRNITFTLTIVLGLGIAFVIGYLKSDGKFDNMAENLIILAGGMIVGLAFSFIITEYIVVRHSKTEGRTRFAETGAQTSFISIEDTIAMRRFELEETYRKIEKLLAYSFRDKENKRKIMETRSVISAQLARYTLREMQIHLIRLQNDLMPIFYETPETSTEKSADLLQLTDDTIEALKSMRGELTDSYAIEFPPSTLDEREEFLARIDETENSCETLREKLVGRHAKRALQEISARCERFDVFEKNALAHSIETFNAQTALTDFSRDFEQLEREHRRICVESETSDKLLEI